MIHMEPETWQVLKDGIPLVDDNGYRDIKPLFVEANPDRHRYSVRPLYTADQIRSMVEETHSVHRKDTGHLTTEAEIFRAGWHEALDALLAQLEAK